MKEFSIPESWGKLDSEATHSFGFGKDAVLALMHEILNRLAWAKAEKN